MKPSYLHRITLRQMQIFQSVCQTRNYSRAAEQLALTQPAVSSQIKQLENLVEEKLFEYADKKLLLTAAGELLQRAAIDISQRLISTEMELSALAGHIQGTLHIAIESSAQYFLPAILAQFKKEYPSISIHIDVKNHTKALESLYSNRVELAITCAPPTDRSVDFTPFRDNVLVVVAHPSHRLASAPSLSLHELSDETLLVREPGSGTRQLFEQIAKEESVVFKQTERLDSLEAIKAATKSQLGIAALPLDCCNQDIDNQSLTILPVQQFPQVRSWCTLKLRRHNLTPVSQHFLQHLMASN